MGDEFLTNKVLSEKFPQTVEKSFKEVSTVSISAKNILIMKNIQ
jgi:hypothetical protein